jgi:peptidoglycan L-alanyl-D-glutamate endopeptidase CwlK
MVAAVFKKDPLFFQRLAKSSGLYAGNLDGSWGPLTQGAADAWDKLAAATAKTYGTFDSRTEENIASLVPKAQRAARQFLVAAKAFPYTVKILSGGRTYAQQTAIYNQGRVKGFPGPIVTKAPAGSSNHNFGIAFDVGIFDGSKYFTGETAATNKPYLDLRKLTKPAVLELDWGGEWRTSKDYPHYELHTGMSVQKVRAALESGTAYV